MGISRPTITPSEAQRQAAVFSDCGYHKLLNSAYDQFDQPADYATLQNKFYFPFAELHFYTRLKKIWSKKTLTYLWMISLPTLMAPPTSLVLALGVY